MPSYNFINQNTNEIETHFMKFSEIDQYLIDNPHLSSGVNTPSVINNNLISSKGVKSKPDDGFRDVLKKVKSAHYGSNINTF